MTEDAKVDTPQGGNDQPPISDQESESQEQKSGLASLPDWAQSEIRKARDEAASRRVQQRETEEKLQEMQEEKLAAEKRWQELAQTRQEEIGKLKPKAEQADALSALLKDQLINEIAEWPESVKALAPSGEDPLALLAWVGQARSVVDDLKKKSPAPGNSAAPPPSSSEPVREPASAIVNVRSRF